MVALFALTALSGCIGADEPEPAGPKTVTEVAEGAAVEAFTFEAVRFDPSGAVDKIIREYQEDVTGGSQLCEPVGVPGWTCFDRTDYQVKWNVEGLPPMATQEGLGDVFYYVWVGEDVNGEVTWTPNGPYGALEGAISDQTRTHSKWQDAVGAIVSIEADTDAKIQIPLLETRDELANGTALHRMQPFAAAFGEGDLEMLGDGKVNVTINVLGLPKGSVYDAWLENDGAVTRLGRLAIEPVSGGLGAVYTLDESQLSKWSIFISLESGEVNDKVGFPILKARFSS